MAWVRNKDVEKVKKFVSKDYGVALTRIKRGYHKRVQSKVPTYNYYGELVTKPTKKKLKKVM